MCCGALLASDIATLVMGARHVHGESRWGDYTVEKLVPLVGGHGRLEVVTGILTQACADIRYA
jgi:tRNA(Arg) A34 adenosine deaminase TadA